MNPLVIIISCLILWTIAWGFFAYFLWMRGTDYVRGYLKTTLYFLSVGMFTAGIFWETLQPFVHPMGYFALIVLVAFMLLQLLLYVGFPRIISIDHTYFSKYPMREYLSFNWRRLISKSADIFAQQVFIVLMILSLRNLGLSILETTLSFGGLFALIHIPPVTREWGNWPAWTFGGAVVVFSLLFPTIILTVQYGFVYTFIIHWIFYTGTAVCFWLLQERK